MSLKQQIGPRGYLNGLGVATLSYQPPFDRAGIIRSILIGNVSAGDNWTVTVGGREIMRFRLLTTDNQRVLFPPNTSGAAKPTFFDYCRRALGLDPSVPVPLGMTAVVASVGGATADIQIEFLEVDSADLNAGQTNHYMGQSFLVPVYGSLNASQALPAIVQFDTQVAPPWVPALFTNTPLPVNWAVDILAMFFEGLSNNSFSGAANHVGATQDVHVFKNQTQLFSRVGHGPLNKSAAAAAGSANIVTTPLSQMFAPFENDFENPDNVLDVPLTLRGGEALQVLHDIAGDLTGGEIFARALGLFICRVTVPASSGGQL